jgi:hypothetical protein
MAGMRPNQEIFFHNLFLLISCVAANFTHAVLRFLRKPSTVPPEGQYAAPCFAVIVMRTHSSYIATSAPGGYMPIYQEQDIDCMHKEGNVDAGGKRKGRQKFQRM